MSKSRTGHRSPSRSPASPRRTEATARSAALLSAALFYSAASGAFAVTGVDPQNNVIRQWNDATLQAVRATRPGPPMVARMLAIVNTCAFDAWAAFDPAARGTRVGRDLKAPDAIRDEASKAKAVAFAAYRANLDLFPQPEQKRYFRRLLVEQGYDPGEAVNSVDTAAGIGIRLCKAVINYRHKDKSNQLGEMNGGLPYSDWTGYAPVNSPDVVVDPSRWQPLRVPDGNGGYTVQKFLAPHWGQVTPFALTDWDLQVVEPVRALILATQGRVGPAAAGEPAYAEQVAQVVAYSATLTGAQKAVAEYWSDGPSTETPPGHWALFAGQVSDRDDHGLDEDVKLYFALSNTVFDTSIAVWGAKVKFDSVRPITAVRYHYAGTTVRAWLGPHLGAGELDGADWQPYQKETFVTPPFAEYPSGHSAYSAASAEILKRFTGSDVFGGGVTLPAGSSRIEPGSGPGNDVDLSWATFTDAADEAGMSRRYGGIHFVDGDLDARLMGRRVAALTWPKILYHFGED